MTKYEIRREIQYLLRKANRTIGMRRLIWRKIKNWLSIGVIVLSVFYPIIVWLIFVYAIMRFIFKW